jgi:cobalt-zinc-cadmium efflux system membrane fusion protein
MFSFHRQPGSSGGAPADWRLLIGGAVAIVLAAAAGFGLARWTSPAPGDAHAEEGEHADEHGGAEAGEGRVSLSAAEAERLGIAIVSIGNAAGGELTLPGRVSLLPGAEASVDSPVAGVVIAVHVGPGDRVRPGSVLATLRSAEGAASRSEVDAAQAAFDAARAAERRDRTLFEQGWIAESRLEVTVAEMRRVEAELRAARARAATYGAPGSDGRVQVRTPIGGVVTNVSVTPGQVLHEEALQVARVSDARRTELAFEAPPQAAGQVGIGDRLSATMPGADPIPAVVTAIAPVNEAGVVLVRARASGALPAVGTVVSARVVSGGEGSLAVPLDAVQSVEGVPSVFVFDGEGFRATPVVTGVTSGGMVEIVSGLDGDERIAGRNAFLLKAELGRGEAEHAH